MNGSFIQRTLRSALSLLKESLFAEETANRKGMLQSLDPRVRVLSLLMMILTVLFLKSLTLLGALYILVILLALASRLSLPFFLVRTWFFIPLFSLFVVLPALFSQVSPGETVLRMDNLSITRQGLWAVALFTLRVADSVSLGLLLTLTTRHFALLKTLRVFGIPQIFVLVMGMAYRYIYLFMEILENTHRAVQSRVGNVMPEGKGRRLVAWNMAHLWIRSHQMSDRVYQAMLSRGFQGEPVLADDLKTRARDWFFLAIVGSILLGFFAARKWAGS